MLQRRHFEAVASAVGRALKQTPAIVHNVAFVYALAEELRCENEKFDPDRFVDACLKGTTANA